MIKTYEVKVDWYTAIFECWVEHANFAYREENLVGGNAAFMRTLALRAADNYGETDPFLTHENIGDFRLVSIVRGT